jgi:predicted DNA-binding protein (UPF0251 family)
LFTEFKPVGIKGQDLQQIQLTLDEFEAVRLTDQLGMSHESAADEMEISRSTFTRLIEKARKKIADFIIQGRMLIIEGGSIHFRNNIIRCLDCGHMFRTTIEQSTTNCPSCDSKNLFNLAGGFGHGRCCNQRRHQKKGGNCAGR